MSSVNVQYNSELKPDFVKTHDRIMSESPCVKRDNIKHETNIIRSEKRQVYLVCIGVIEGRHYAMANMDSSVIINVGKKKRKRTRIIHDTDNPYYNQLKTTFQKLLDTSILFTVVRPRRCCTRTKILGYFKLDAGTVWNQPNHVFFHKWAVLRNLMQAGKSSIKGYLKLDLAVVAKGQTPKFPVQEIGDIEDNLLLPEGITIDRSPAGYVFKIYKAEVLMMDENNLPSAYIKINFAGLTGKTAIKNETTNPVWNTEIIFHDLYPPLTQNISININYKSCIKPYLVAEKHINLKSICTIEEPGFPPTFGPDYLHFYTPPPNVRYAGRLLLEIDTILYDIQQRIPTMEVLVRPTVAKKNIWELKKFLLFFIIHSVPMIDEKFDSELIYFEISTGSKSDLNDTKYMSKKFRVIKDNTKQNRYIDLTDVKPCLSIVSERPESQITLYRGNMLRNTYNNLKNRLDMIEHNIESSNNHKEAISNELERNNINSILNELIRNCREYVSKGCLSITEGTVLDKMRLRFSLNKIHDIQLIINKIQDESRIKVPKKSLRRLFKISKILQTLLNYEDSWPDVFVHMFCNDKKIGSFSIPARKIIYSDNDLECGRQCGVIFPIDLKNIKHKIGESVQLACKMEGEFWLGPFEKHYKCFDNIPDFYELEPNESIPHSLIPREKTMFECLVYVLEGKFIPGADNSGLADPFVRIIFGDQVRHTKTRDKTLYPIWDETLIFQKILLDGNISYIKENLPIIHLEIFDEDVGSVELYGRSCLQPILSYGVQTVKIKLRWYPVYTPGENLVGEILVAAELIQINKDQPALNPDNMPIPNYIKPHRTLYRMEVLFWGIREMKTSCSNCCGRYKPSIRIECGKNQLHSNTIVNYKNYPNFTPHYDFIDVELPEDVEYMPMIAIKMFNSISCKRLSFIGVNMQHPINCLYTPLTGNDYARIIYQEEKLVTSDIQDDSERIADFTSEDNETITNIETTTNIKTKQKLKTKLLNAFNNLLGTDNETFKNSKAENIAKDRFCMKMIDFEEIDWWTKFYNSLEDLEHSNEDRLTCRSIRLKIYPNELENQKEFNFFSDQIGSYKIYCGKRTGDEILDEQDVVAVFKGRVKLYKWSPQEHFITPYGGKLETGLFQHMPDNEQENFLARIYVIRALNIRPLDWNGNSDSYIGVSIGGTKIYDKKNIVINQINPVFGRCFEVKGTFPHDTILTVSVWDKDLCSSELVGETKIDLEKRWYTRHRAHCGLPSEYIDKGRCKWRDLKKPTKILEELCELTNLENPKFWKQAVKVGPCVFISEREITGTPEQIKEKLALMALRRWKEIPLVGCHLVPEHVETRTLYNPSKPGLEQGKLQLWIDIFDSDEYTPPAVDIKPHKPIDYELRVIVWNTDNVKLQEDDFLIGYQKSDIYVKGWITDPSESQCTDVHYNSITGEGNFNWRFVFPFTYIPVEKKLVFRKKQSIFSTEETEYKLPCNLNIQILDNDTFSTDDFIGTVQLNLSKMPRGAKTRKDCDLKLLTSKWNTINLFKTKRYKGWWPCWNRNENDERGKIEMELELLIKEEAEGKIVGLGRDPPFALPPPNRPDISFAWFKNPFKLCKYTWKAHKVAIILYTLVILSVLFLLFGIYSMPTLIVKKYILPF